MNLRSMFNLNSNAYSKALLKNQNEEFKILNKILHNEEIIMATLDEVIANVADEDTIIDSAVLTINSLQAQIAALKTPSTDKDTAAKIDALNADISAKKAKLAAAIVTNTPSVPPVTVNTPVIAPADATSAAEASVKANPVDPAVVKS